MCHLLARWPKKRSLSMHPSDRVYTDIYSNWRICVAEDIFFQQRSHRYNFKYWKRAKLFDERLASIRQMMASNFNQLNFDNPFFLSDNEYITLTGFNKTRFQEIRDSLTSWKNFVLRSKNHKSSVLSGVLDLSPAVNDVCRVFRNQQIVIISQ